MRFSRIRRKETASTFGGTTEFSDVALFEGETPLPNASGEGVFVSARGYSHSICCDIDNYRYDTLGVEQMHDFFMDKTFIEKNAFIDADVVQLDFAPGDGDAHHESTLLVRGFDLLPAHEHITRPALSDQIEALPKTLINKAPGWEIEDPNVLRCEPTNEFDTLSPTLAHMDLSAQFSPVAVLLGRANPLAPVVNVPSFLVETFMGLSGLILAKGRNLLRIGGSVYLSYEFGWKPLMSDFKNLIDYSRQISKRLKTLAALRGSQTVTNKVGVEKAEGTTTRTIEFPVPFAPWRTGIVLIYEVDVETKLERWGSVKYVSSELSKPSNLAYFERLVQSWDDIAGLYGLHWRNPSALWEVLPWSWLIDWFIPVQPLLDAETQNIKLYPEQGVLMTKTTTTFTGRLVDVQWPPGTSGTVDVDSAAFTIVRETKERNLITDVEHLPSAPIGRGLFNDRKLRILIALLLQRLH